MNPGPRQILAAVVVSAMTLTTTVPARAQTGTIGISKSDAAWIVVGIAAIGAGIGIGIYFAVHHNHSLTGCSVAGANGLELENQADQQAYALVGAVSGIKPGERVRVSGKRVKKSSGPLPQFLVEHQSRDFRACRARPATP